MLREEENKIIDESRQGEALVIPDLSGNGKKLYLESYFSTLESTRERIATSFPENDDVFAVFFTVF